MRLRLQQAFLNFMMIIINNYIAFVVPDYASPAPRDLFDTESYLASVPEVLKPFYREFVNSHMFSEFVLERTSPKFMLFHSYLETLTSTLESPNMLQNLQVVEQKQNIIIHYLLDNAHQRHINVHLDNYENTFFA